MHEIEDTARLKSRLAELERENARLRAGLFEPSEPRVVHVPEQVEPLFQLMESTMRAFFQRVEIDPARALIAVDQERYLLVRASAFSIDFLDALVQLYADRGEREALSIARGFLFDIAHTIGLHDARTMHEKLGCTDPVDKLTGGPIHFAYTGWSQVLIREGSRLVHGEEFCLLYEHPYSFEADSYRRADRRSKGPACIMNAGYSSGWCEACFGVELTALEVTCKACGDESCQFVMGPPERVAELARTHYGVVPESLAKAGFEVPLYFERKRAEEEVRNSLRRLREAQDELVRKERLATVGLLVSGVAHEVNTPLGVAVTATSVLQEELAALKSKFDQGTLTKADMRSFLEHTNKAEELVRTNLERASAEITRFKRISVDHATEEKREIDVGIYLRHTVDSLGPVARAGALDVTLRTEGDLVCVTYPGALAQIVTNFLTNSAKHARAGEPGCVAVDISLTLRDREFTLTYADDGRGMDEEVKTKAFQPFFTTRRSDGGSGLGLFIVQSLVTEVLRGRVQLETGAGRGTRFVITFPVELSDA
jgi:signal transduction histidine kinase/predicted hydrocarbon binding protein